MTRRCQQQPMQRTEGQPSPEPKKQKEPSLTSEGTWEAPRVAPRVTPRSPRRLDGLVYRGKWRKRREKPLKTKIPAGGGQVPVGTGNFLLSFPNLRSS